MARASSGASERTGRLEHGGPQTAIEDRIADVRAALDRLAARLP